MASDINVERFARVLVDRHGDEALGIATANLHDCKKRDDLEMAVTWEEIIQAIGDL